VHHSTLGLRVIKKRKKKKSADQIEGEGNPAVGVAQAQGGGRQRGADVEGDSHLGFRV